MSMESIFLYLKKAWGLLITPFVTLGETPLSVMTFILAVVLFFATTFMAKLSEKLLHNALKDKDIDPGIRGSLEHFARYSVLTIGLLITLDTIGVNFKSLAAIGAVLMVGIGFGLQNITQNFISGLIILLERPIKQGDLVSVGEISGRVIEIGARSTLLQTRDDISIIVPNSQFISERVINDSFSGNKIRLHIKVGVAYGSDVDKVSKILVKVAKDHSSILNDPHPLVFFEDFGNSSLDFSLRVWTKDLWTYDIILSDIRFAIDREFRKEDVTIPFPQRDVHVIEKKKINQVS